MKMKFSVSQAFLITNLVLVTAFAAIPSSASALTVNEVVKDLACPCECPLVLEDCNMTCGLEWKDQVGEMINKGMTKQQIMDYFIGKYGDEARITPLQRINGKIYQYTRSFDTADWVLLWGGIIVWILLMFFGVYIGVKRLFFNKSQDS
jgi:cytochrome c-type biogenesis protein CcmH/NrfF